MSEQLPPPDDTGDASAGDRAFGSGARTDATDHVRPGDFQARAADADAWATACAEDLEAERARRRARYGPPPTSASEELRKLADVVADRFGQLTGLRSPLLGAVVGPAAQQAVRQVVRQAKAVVEPVVERNPDVFGHLAAAGDELLAAYHSVLQDQERRRTVRATPPRGPDGAADASAAEGGSGGPNGDSDGNDDRRRNREDASGSGGERTDLD